MRMVVRGRTRLAARLVAVCVLATVVGFATNLDQAPPPSAPPAEPGVLVAETDTFKQTEADAVATAKAKGHAVEIGAFRGERRDVWANPDGSYVENTHLQAVRTVKNHRWVTPDATLRANSDGSLSPVAATFGLRFSGGGTGPLLTAERGGKTMSLTWPGGPLPAPVVDGDSATYPEVAPGIDLVVNAGTETFSHVLVVKTPQAARRAEVTDLALDLGGNGLTVRDAGDGRLAAVDVASGGKAFEAPQPVMWDAGDQGQERWMAAESGIAPEKPTRVAPATARKASLGVRVAGGKLHLTPDRNMLSDPATRYPVYIDPVWSSTTTSFWAMVDSGYPTTAYPKFDGSYQTRSDERAGYCPPDPDCNNSLVKRLMYTLPTNYTGKTIISASFQISLLRGWNSTPRDISLYRMGGGISTSTTWNNMPAWSELQQTKSVGAEQSCSSTTRNTSFNAWEAVNFAARNGRTTTTFGLRAVNESNNQHSKRFCENALLSVHWNRSPVQPAAGDLSLSPGGACVFGAGAPYVDTPPRLSAVLRDPDHLASGAVENVRGEFRVQWTPPGGTIQTITWTSSYKASGSRFDYTVPSSIPQNVVISWDVRAYDEHATGPWSSDGAAEPCQFVYDNTTPSPPLVSSPEFLEEELVDCSQYSDATWRNGVGVYTTFTFDSEATDVVEYRWGVNTNPSPSNVLVPSVDGGPVTLQWLATEEGPTFITVEARDRANRVSAIANCTFRVSAGATPVAEWQMGDGQETTEAADQMGQADAVKHGDVLFGVEGPGGPADRAARFPGTPGAYLATDAPRIVDTTKSFSVSAHVRLAELGRDQVVLSQDGSGEPGFTLGYDAAKNKWSFAAPVTDIRSLGSWQVTGGMPTVGVWVHLVGVYDAQAKTIALHVNGTRTESPRRTAFNSRGAIQIGQRMDQTGYVDHLNGDVADVAVFNRMVVPTETDSIAEVKATRAGYWRVNAASGGTSPSVQGPSLTLGGGASVMVEDPFGDPPVIPMVGTGELWLDGIDDHATAAPVVATDRSFTAVARVRVASPDAGQPPMALLSQKGTHTSAFVIRRNAANQWELAMTGSDTIGGVETVAVDDESIITAESVGQLIALVYNAFTNEARLYVDGHLALSARVKHAMAWNATGDLQVGRGFLAGSHQQYLSGAVDEVRVYSGALDQTTIQQLTALTEVDF